MPMNRRDFLKAATAGTAAWLAACRKQEPPPTQAAAGKPAAFTMKVIDGYAYVFSDQRKKLTIGAIDAPPHGGGNVIKHPIRVLVKEGTVTTKPFEPNEPNVWDLTGWHVELDLGNSARPLALPAMDVLPANVTCPSGEAEWNNLAWLPPAAKVYPNNRVKDTWMDELSSRLVVTQAQMAVRDSEATGLWRFIDESSNKEVWRQPMSDATEFMDQIPEGGNVTLRFFQKKSAPPQPGEAPAHMLVITPVNNRVEIEINNGLDDKTPYKVGEVVRHFRRYAALMADAAATQVLPHFAKCPDGGGDSPGIFCPYVTYDA